MRGIVRHMDGTASTAQRVHEVMAGSPKTLPAETTVGELRELFANPKVRLALLADGDHFAGALERDTIPDDVDGDKPAREFARTDIPTVRPDAPVDEALEVMNADGRRRLVVLDADGSTLRGLLCLTSDRSGFCQ
jgi:CBS domain-containing protein